jgi:OmpA-OmpF porin, OOP family
MIHRMKTLAAALAFAGLCAGPAGAQTAISPEQMVQNLAAATAAAPQGLTAAIIRQAAIEHMQQFRGEPATRQPLALRLDDLAQITVQIQFALNSAIIRPESYQTIGSIADALHHPLLLGHKFIITGNTDTTGTRELNLKLSQERADAVMEALTTTFMVDPARLEAVGLGEEALEDVQNPTNPVNRRVEIINVGTFLPR